MQWRRIGKQKFSTIGIATEAAYSFAYQSPHLVIKYKNALYNVIVDTGATVSLIKSRCVFENEVNKNENINIVGIGNKEIKSIGVCSMRFCIVEGVFEDSSCVDSFGWKFHVVSNDMLKNIDGILGIDFLKVNGCKIDYEKNVLKIKNVEYRWRNFDNASIPARSECFRFVSVNGTYKNGTDLVIEKTEFGKYLIPNCLSKINNNQCLVSIVNKSNSELKLSEVRNLKVESLGNFAIKEDKSDKNQGDFGKEPNGRIPRTQNKNIVKNRNMAVKKNGSEFHKYSLTMPENGPVQVGNIFEDEFDKNKSNEKIKNMVKSKSVSEFHKDYLPQQEKKPVRAVNFSECEIDKVLKQKIDSVQASLRLEHLNNEEQSSIRNLVSSYIDLFIVQGEKLTSTDIIKCQIRTKENCKPIYTKSYRYPKVHEEVVEKEIEKLSHEGIIKNSVSPWNSPVWIVPKKSDASGKVKW